jgi:excisionase family DNA binding protein
MPKKRKKASSKTMSVADVALLLRTSNGTVLRLCEEGKLRRYRRRKGGNWRISKSSIAEFERRLRAQGGG